MRIVQPALLEGVADQVTVVRAPKSFEGRRLVGRFLLLGAGVQSSCLAYMVAQGDLEPVDAVLFADTKDEPWWVYQQVGNVRRALAERGIPLIWCHHDCWGLSYTIRNARYQARFASIPVYVTRPGDRPAPLPRQCTSEYKVAPNNREIKRWLAWRGIVPLPAGWTVERSKFSGAIEMCWRGMPVEHPGEWPALRVPKDVYVEIWLGISKDELIRADPERGELWQRARYPLIEAGMTRQDCEDRIAAYGYPIPDKSACVQCPYRSDRAWLWMKQNHLDVFEQAAAFDDWLRSDDAQRHGYAGIRGVPYLHRSGQSLRSIDFEALTRPGGGLQPALLEEELLADRCGTDGGFSCMT